MLGPGLRPFSTQVNRQQAGALGLPPLNRFHSKGTRNMRHDDFSGALVALATIVPAAGLTAVAAVLNGTSGVITGGVVTVLVAATYALWCVWRARRAVLIATEVCRRGAKGDFEMRFSA